MRLIVLFFAVVVSSDPLGDLRHASGFSRDDFLKYRFISAVSRVFPAKRPSILSENWVEIGETVDGIWDAIKESPYTLDEMRHHKPKNVNGVIWQNTMSNHNFIIRTSTTSPCPHAKKLHAFGSWARVRWDAEPGTPYDGLWNQSNLTGLLRASRNGLLIKNTHPLGASEYRSEWANTSKISVSENTAFTTKFSVALRLCLTHVLAGCEDIVFLPKETVAWEGGHLFAQHQHTNVTFDPWTSQAFSQVSTEPGFVNLSHVGEHSSPLELRLEPTDALVDAWESGKDWRLSISKLPQDTVLYVAFDENDIPIGNLTQTSDTWVASEVGDTRVTFNHHVKEDVNLNFQPIHVRAIPLEWLFAPSLIHLLNTILYQENPDLDPFFGTEEIFLSFAGNDKFRLTLLEPIIHYVISTVPSTGSLLNYFVNSTEDIQRFAAGNINGTDIAQSNDIAMLGAVNGEVGRFTGRWTTPFYDFTTEPRFDDEHMTRLQQVSANILTNRNTGLSNTKLTIPTRWFGVLDVLLKHKSWFDEAYRREFTFWRTIGRESLFSQLIASSQNDPRRFRFTNDIESDAWIDTRGNNRSCPAKV